MPGLRVTSALFLVVAPVFIPRTFKLNRFKNGILVTEDSSFDFFNNRGLKFGFPFLCKDVVDLSVLVTQDLVNLCQELKVFGLELSARCAIHVDRVVVHVEHVAREIHRFRKLHPDLASFNFKSHIQLVNLLVSLSKPFQSLVSRLLDHLLGPQHLQRLGQAFVHDSSSIINLDGVLRRRKLIMTDFTVSHGFLNLLLGWLGHLVLRIVLGVQVVGGPGLVYMDRRVQINHFIIR